MNTDPHFKSAVQHTGAPLKDATLAVVLLHGRGGSAEDILSLAQAIFAPGVAYIAPQANGHTWYPLSFLSPREANEPFLSSALAKVESVVLSLEEAGLSRDRIVIGGFSQGACLATEFVATHPARYAGLFAFTGGLIGPPGSIQQNFVGAKGSELAGVPVFFGGGDPDPHVPWSRIEESASVLSAMGAHVATRRYPGHAHTIGSEEVEFARSIVLRAIAQN
jgi:predicted esterase